MAEKKTDNKPVPKKRKSYSPIDPANMPVDPGDNAKYLSNALTIIKMPRVDLYDPQAVEKRIMDYFELQIQNDMKPSVTGLANALGISNDDLWRIRTGKWREGRDGSHGGIAGLPKESADMIKRGHAVLKSLWEDYMQNGKINPVAGIFLGTNHFGMKNTRDVVIEAAEDNSDSRSESELIKSAGLLPSDLDSDEK